MVYVDLILVACIWVLILDISGFVPEVEDMMTRMLKLKRGRVVIPKPFSCSLCMTFWTGLIYLLVIGQCNFWNIFMTLLVAVLTPEIGELILTAKDIVRWILNKLNILLK